MLDPQMERQFDAAFRQAQSQFMAVASDLKQMSTEAWNEEFAKALGSGTLEAATTGDMKFDQAWEAAATGLESIEAYKDNEEFNWAENYDDEAIQGYFSNSRTIESQEYVFEPNNTFLSSADPFAEGLKIMESGGLLTLAALAFEAAVQKDASHAEAWAQLGRVQAENEKEEPAIAALQQATRLDPQHGDALMVRYSCHDLILLNVILYFFIIF